MVIDGVFYSNVTCPKCRYRHPIEFSCKEASDLAERGRRPLFKTRDPRTIEEQLQEAFTRIRALEDRLGLYK